jgi:hypothetical protein
VSRRALQQPVLLDAGPFKTGSCQKPHGRNISHTLTIPIPAINNRLAQGNSRGSCPNLHRDATHGNHESFEVLAMSVVGTDLVMADERLANASCPRCAGRRL